MERTRLIAGILLVLLIAAGLIYVVVSQASEVDQPTSAGEPTASAEAPLPDLVASPEPSPESEEEPEPVAVPTPDTAGRDFDHIFREINEFRNWLYRNPDPSLVSLIYHPECECHEETTRQLTDLAENGLAFDDEGFVLQSVDVVEDFPSLVRLHVTLHRTPQRIVDEDGNTVNESDGVETMRLNVVLVMSGSGQWRSRTIRHLSADQ